MLEPSSFGLTNQFLWNPSGIKSCVTIGFVENATALGETGAGDLILKVIKMHMDKQDLVLAGLKAMNAICFHNRENSLRCISHRAYELIIAGNLS